MGRDGLERRAGVVKPHRDVLRRAGLVGVDRADDVVGLGNHADLGRVLCTLGDHFRFIVAGGVVVAVVRVLGRVHLRANCESGRVDRDILIYAPVCTAWQPGMRATHWRAT